MLGRPSHRLPRAYVIPIVIVALAVLIGAGLRLLRPMIPVQPLPAPTVSTTHLTRLNEGGQVTIKATWQGRMAGPVFTIVMDTHAVDLDSYDLTQLAVLRVDGGPELTPIRWDAPVGGHHREGTLTFAEQQAGKPVINAQTRTIELIVRDVAGEPERVLIWDL